MVQVWADDLPRGTGCLIGDGLVLTTVGAAPVGHGMPAQVADLVTNVVHTTFISGMNAAFMVASVVALAGAAVALLTRRGRAVEGAAAI